MKRGARRIDQADLERLRAALAADRTLAGARLRAIVTVAHAAALELAEVLALPMRPLLLLGADRPWTLRAPVLLPIATKTVQLPELARAELARWIAEAARTYALVWPPAPALACFMQYEHGAYRSAPARTVQHRFRAVQQLARCAAHYRFSDLRHDAIAAYAARTRDLALTAQYARLSPRAALAYLPPAPRLSLAAVARAGERR